MQTMELKRLKSFLMIAAALYLQTYSFAQETAPVAQQKSDSDLATKLRRLTGQRDATASEKATFQILHLGLKSGTLRFNGWRRPSSNWHEDYVVNAGSDGDVRLALVKKEIEIIRRFYSDDFQWISQRSGEAVVLSARQEDNASLETFLLKENFPD